jgi:hypothetical protein
LKNGVAHAPPNGAAEWSEAQKQLVRAQLERILKSPPFKHTRRCQSMLLHTVGQVLDGRVDRAKERDVGIAVFGRAPDYDTNQDPVVRMAAVELRRRLAQFYDEATEAPLVRIEFPSGSYAPEFHWSTPVPPVPEAAGPVPPAPHRRRGWRLGLSAAAVLAGAVVFYLLMAAPDRSVLSRFWAPVIEGQRPVLIAVGLVASWAPSERIRSQFSRNPHEPVLVGPDDIDLVPNLFIPFGDCVAISRFSSLLTARRKEFQIRGVPGPSFSDLRDFPTILVGAKSNEWTIRLSAKSRFFVSGYSICDRSKGDAVAWSIPRPAVLQHPDDYAIASRMFDATTGNLVVTAAGILPYGTQAAGELLTSNRYLEAALRRAPQDWYRRNLQIVIHTKVVGGVPGPPEVVAWHVW